MVRMYAIKRSAALFLCLILLLALPGCGDTYSGSSSKEPEQHQLSEFAETAQPTAEVFTQDVAPEKDVNGVLVVYFSRTGEQYEVGVIEKGNTAVVADMIIEATGADAFEILPTNDTYPITYKELTDMARQEQNENARTEIAGELPDLS